MTKAQTHGAKRAAKRARAALGGDVGASGAAIAYEQGDATGGISGEPTPEQRKQGHYVRSASERGGRLVWHNDDCSPLRSALRRGKLTRRQVDAGEKWEEAYVGAELPTGPRSCLDNTVRGKSDHVSPGHIDAVKRWRDVVQAVGMVRSAVLTSVCVRQEPIGDMGKYRKRAVALVEGLNLAADHWGLERE